MAPLSDPDLEKGPGADAGQDPNTSATNTLNANDNKARETSSSNSTYSKDDELKRQESLGQNGHGAEPRGDAGSSSGSDSEMDDNNNNSNSNNDDAIYHDNASAMSVAYDPDATANAESMSLGKVSTTASTASRPPDFEVYFRPDDPENPQNWSMLYKGWIMAVISFSAWIVPLFSTSYTASIPGLMEEFGVTQTYATLGVTTYLIGLGVGCLVFAPLSELYGRRWVYLICMVISALFIVPCGVAQSMEQQLACRFAGALFGAALISNSPGTVVDISSEKHRALYMSLAFIAPLNGPVTGPILGGVVFENLGWRWCNWIVLILAGASFVAMLTVRETYAPTILRKRVARLRKETDDPRWWCRYDSRLTMRQLLWINMSRPFIMAYQEPILWGANIWISVIYAILYLCFIAYPVVFSQHRGWGPTTSGLAFCGIGIGILGAIACEPLLRRISNAHPRDPKTGRPQPEGAARIMTIGAILAPLGQLGFSWTGLPVTIHWAVPIAFGIPFGAGNTLCFIYGANYLGGVYGIYAASALAGNAVIRSFAGGVLPLAGPRMYEALSPQWAGTLLGLLEVILIPVPLAFWKYGERIRSKSPIIKQMREDQMKNENRRARAEAKMAEKKAREEARGRGDSEKTVANIDGPVEEKV